MLLHEVFPRPRKKSDDRRVIADVDERIRLRPGDSMAYNNRGSTLRDIGDHARALADDKWAYDTAREGLALLPAMK